MFYKPNGKIAVLDDDGGGGGDGDDGGDDNNEDHGVNKVTICASSAFTKSLRTITLSKTLAL